MHWRKRHLRNRNLRGSDRESLLFQILPSSSSSFISEVQSVASTLWKSVFSCVSRRSSFRSRSSWRLCVRRRSAQSFFDDYKVRTSTSSERSQEEPEIPMRSERELRGESVAEPKAEQRTGPATGSPPTPQASSYPEVPSPEYNEDHRREFEKYQAGYAKANAMWKKRARARDQESLHSRPQQDGEGPSGRVRSAHEAFDLFAKSEPEEEAISEKLPAYEEPPEYERGSQ